MLRNPMTQQISKYEATTPTTEPKKKGTLQIDRLRTEQAVEIETPEESNQPNLSSGGIPLRLSSLSFQSSFLKGERPGAS